MAQGTAIFAGSPLFTNRRVVQLDPAIAVGHSDKTMYNSRDGINRDSEDSVAVLEWNIVDLDQRFCRRFWHSINYKLLERKCYVDLYAQVEKAFSLGCGMAIVLGNPGIGKTGFLIYFLARLMQDGKRILFQTKAGTRYMYTRTNTGDYDVRRGSFEDELFNDEDLYYLIDGGIAKTPEFLGHALLCCSPNHENWNDAAKYGGRVLLYMPVWSFPEIMIANREIYNRPEGELLDNYEKWGGIPRFVLVEVNSSPLLESAISGCANIEGVVRVACAQTADKEHPSHKVMHMQVMHGYREYRYVWASDYVRNKVFRVLYSSQKTGLKSFLAFSANPALNSFKGELLQLFCKEHFPSGGRYQAKNVYPDAPPSSTFPITLPPRQLYEFNGLLRNADIPVSDQYIFWPNNKRQETFDFFWLETENGQVIVHAVQVTYSSEKDQHGLKQVGVEQLKDKFGIEANKIIVYILTPVEMFRDAGHQCWMTTKDVRVVSQTLLSELHQVRQVALAYESNYFSCFENGNIGLGSNC